METATVPLQPISSIRVASLRRSGINGNISEYGREILIEEVASLRRSGINGNNDFSSCFASVLWSRFSSEKWN